MVCPSGIIFLLSLYHDTILSLGFLDIHRILHLSSRAFLGRPSYGKCVVNIRGRGNLSNSSGVWNSSILVSIARGSYSVVPFSNIATISHNQWVPWIYMYFIITSKWNSGASSFCPVCLSVNLWQKKKQPITLIITFEPQGIDTSYLACILN